MGSNLYYRKLLQLSSVFVIVNKNSRNEKCVCVCVTSVWSGSTQFPLLNVLATMFYQTVWSKPKSITKTTSQITTSIFLDQTVDMFL